MTNQTKTFCFRNYKKKREREREKGYLRMEEIIFKQYYLIRRLIAKINKKLIQLNTTNDLIKNWSEDPNKTFFQRRYTDGNRLMERCST